MSSPTHVPKASSSKVDTGAKDHVAGLVGQSNVNCKQMDKHRPEICTGKKLNETKIQIRMAQSGTSRAKENTNEEMRKENESTLHGGRSEVKIKTSFPAFQRPQQHRPEDQEKKIDRAPQ